MTANEIKNKIYELNNDLSFGLNEQDARNSAQTVLLAIENSKSLNTDEKEALTSSLRKAVRKLISTDYHSGCDAVEINSLLEELCVAADFYLLQKEKRIRLYTLPEERNVSLNLRAFENAFYSVISSILKTDSEASVEIKDSGKPVLIIIRGNELPLSPPESSLVIYEKNEKGLCLILNKAKNNSVLSDEDFSLLLADRMSPLQIWLCDI